MRIEEIRTVARRLRRVTNENHESLTIDMVIHDLDTLLNLILEEGKDE